MNNRWPDGRFCRADGCTMPLPSLADQFCPAHLRDVFAPARKLLDAGYDNGFGVTSLDTLLCEGMSRAERLDFALFLISMITQASGPTKPQQE